MAGDVFYQETKPTQSPRGAIVPPGCSVEEVDGRQILRVPAAVTHIETAIIFPGFTLLIEGPELQVAGETIADAAIYVESVEAPATALAAVKEIETTDLLQARSVRGHTVRAGRIEALYVEAELSVRATEAVIAKRVVVHHGAVRTPLLVGDEISGENAARETLNWSQGLAAGSLPDWLQQANS